jgi:adenine/guanine/hypoxanthine permease
VRAAVDRWFRITERGSTVPAEMRGGVATFFTMAYIVVLNPIVLAGGRDVTGGPAPPMLAVAAAFLAYFAIEPLEHLLGVAG